MTVSDLITQLQKLPSDLQVTLEDTNGLIWVFEADKHIRAVDGELILGSKDLNRI